MKNIIKISMSAILALGFAYAARSQACGGINNTITDKHTSSALGQSNMVYGKNSTAIGLENIVSKSDSKTDYAFAIGYKNYATAKLTFAFGDQNTVSHTYSFAFGQKNTVSDGYSFAIGTDNNVNANTSIALGYCIKNSKKYGITIGMGRNPSLPLVNNTDGIMMGINSDKPTLFISRSFCDGRTGRVSIGNVVEPQSKLHIKADNYSYDGEDADILLEPTRADKKAIIYFRDKNNSISMFSNQMTFNAPKYSFTNAGITLGKNTSTQASEISFTGQGGISMSDNRMNFNAREYNFANGAIHAEEVVVEIMRDWPDYVFNDDYQLTNLDEVKKYIDDNGHLPGVPSAEQVSEEGVKLGEINTKLLEKIEELTLYIIQQEERIQALENQLDSITKN